MSWRGSLVRKCEYNITSDQDSYLSSWYTTATKAVIEKLICCTHSPFPLLYPSLLPVSHHCITTQGKRVNHIKQYYLYNHSVGYFAHCCAAAAAEIEVLTNTLLETYLSWSAFKCTLHWNWNRYYVFTWI